MSDYIVLSRDHHDVSGTDSPFRETSNIYDGSAFTADMAVQNCIGDAFRGASWVSLHNGGGVGWGEVINGTVRQLLSISFNLIVHYFMFLVSRRIRPRPRRIDSSSPAC